MRTFKAGSTHVHDDEGCALACARCGTRSPPMPLDDDDTHPSPPGWYHLVFYRATTEQPSIGEFDLCAACAPKIAPQRVVS